MQVTGLDTLRARLGQAAQQVPQVAKRVLFTRLTEAVTYAKTTYLTGGTTSTRLGVRSGALRASFGFQMHAEGGQVGARIGYILPQVTPGGGDPLIYARIHEGWPDGRSSTRITPVRSQYLTIPLDAAKTPAGVARGRARDFPDTFFGRSRRGQLFLFQKQGKEIVPLFLLVKEVVIPARPALRPTLERFIPLIVADLGKGLAEAVRGV